MGYLVTFLQEGANEADRRYVGEVSSYNKTPFAEHLNLKSAADRKLALQAAKQLVSQDMEKYDVSAKVGTWVALNRHNRPVYPPYAKGMNSFPHCLTLEVKGWGQYMIYPGPLGPNYPKPKFYKAIG